MALMNSDLYIIEKGYLSPFIPTKENENVSIANKSSYTEEEIKAAYEKGKSEGRIEGMLSYQKRLIKNLQQDNASLNQMLQEMKK